MFGPSFLAQTDFNYTNKPFLDNTAWCTVHGGISNKTRKCFTGKLNDTSVNGKEVMFLREGTITPIYSYNMTSFTVPVTNDTNFTGSDDLYKLTLDLHVFNDK